MNQPGGHAPEAGAAGTPVAFVWENLGPTHADRLRALAAAGFAVTAIQFAETSGMYSWRIVPDADYRLVTLFGERERVSAAKLAWRLVGAVRRSGAREVFLCHYELPGILLAALVLRLLGRRVFTMYDSKFDDYRRFYWREGVKRAFMSPYRGVIGGSRRSREYLAFLGFAPGRIEPGYNMVDIARIAARVAAAPQPAFAEREFLVIARLVPKKNIPAALEAFALFEARHPGARRLRILGDGPLEGELAAQAAALGIAGRVTFEGFLQAPEVAEALARALALILPSTEEQFGMVINEALAAGVPVICSTAVGAADDLVDPQVNGFLVSPHEPRTILGAMEALHGDERLHAEMARNAAASAPRGDVRNFVAAVRALTGREC